MRQSDFVVIAILQTVVLMVCVASVTLLGIRHVIDAAAVTAILGAVAGSIGVLAGAASARKLINGDSLSPHLETPGGGNNG